MLLNEPHENLHIKACIPKQTYSIAPLKLKIMSLNMIVNVDHDIYKFQSYKPHFVFLELLHQE